VAILPFAKPLTYQFRMVLMALCIAWSGMVVTAKLS
jgi:hypothetical protein